MELLTTLGETEKTFTMIDMKVFFTGAAVTLVRSSLLFLSVTVLAILFSARIPW